MIQEQELSDRILKFAAELARQLSELKEYTDADCEQLDANRGWFDSCPEAFCVGLSCIERAALDAGWYEMAGLSAAVQESISRRSSQSLENQMAWEARAADQRRGQREAAKRKRLEKQAAQAAKEQQPRAETTTRTCQTT